jgi:aminoglycoside phosphotransferase (APT) family kinase protein
MEEHDDWPARLAAFMTGHLDREATVVEFSPITGGYSRYMAKFTIDDGDTHRRYVLRADPPPGQSILVTDRVVEWSVLTAIVDAVAIPPLVTFDTEVLGPPSIIMDCVDGESLFALLQQDPDGDHSAYTDRLATLAADIHTLDVDSLPEVLPRPASWSDYIDAQIQTWIDAEAAHVEHEPFMRLVAAWLDANRPPEMPLAVVHGDFQAPNILVESDGGRFLMCDWEMTRVGDPREDLGWWTLAAKSQPPDLIDQDSEAFFARYRELTGFDEDVVNPATVAYFTVLSSATVFFNLINQTASMTRGETTAMSIAYMTNAMPFMHGVWIDSMRRAGAWSAEVAS